MPNLHLIVYADYHASLVVDKKRTDLDVPCALPPQRYKVRSVEIKTLPGLGKSLFVDGVDVTFRESQDEKQVRTRNHIRGLLQDAIQILFYDDRKEDEDLPRGSLEKAAEEGIISKEWMLKVIEKELDKWLPNDH